ncbi:hypothetical protein SUGI_0282100 [Cryptomeria japonica]|nr:hypothetical protein SUGI_0282100 [Cryptomeria japonica]
MVTFWKKTEEKQDINGKKYHIQSRRRSSGRITSPPVDLSIDKLEADDCSVNYSRWKSVAKRKVAMRVGYVGTNFKGLQIQRDSAPTVTIEGELERAILKAGGMLESNYGNLHKIGWRRSSRTDKGVHSLATVITLKMEVPDGAWVDDPDGTALAEIINQYLPYDVRVFSILPINKGFDARIDCTSRKYMYLLPAEVIGIENNCSPEEIERHVREFRDILQIFKGNHPFHNYTIRAHYRKRSSKTLVKVSRPIFSVEEGSNQESNDCKRKHGNSTKDGNNIEEESLTDSSDIEEDLMNSIQDSKCGPNMSSTPEVSKFPCAKWLHEQDEADLISAAHFRKILSCTCGDLEAIANVRYIEISIHGESFVFHQIRKMVGTAVAVKRGLLPQDIIKISLLRHSRIVLPLAPSEVLVLSGNEFYIPEKFRSWGIPSNSVSARSEISRLTGSDSIQDRVDDFYSTVLLPELATYLDPLKPLWKGWLERLDMSAIPDEEMNKLRRAWIQWQENHVSRKQEVS